MIAKRPANPGVGRHLRLASVMKRELSALLADAPEVEGCSLTDVELTPDCRFARIYVRKSLVDVGKLTPKEEKDFLASLEKISYRVRGHLGSVLQVRFVPEIRFEFDHGLEKAERIESILAALAEGKIPDHSDEEETD